MYVAGKAQPKGLEAADRVASTVTKQNKEGPCSAAGFRLCKQPRILA